MRDPSVYIGPPYYNPNEWETSGVGAESVSRGYWLQYGLLWGIHGVTVDSAATLSCSAVMPKRYHHFVTGLIGECYWIDNPITLTDYRVAGIGGTTRGGSVYWEIVPTIANANMTWHVGCGSVVDSVKTELWGVTFNGHSSRAGASQIVMFTGRLDVSRPARFRFTFALGVPHFGGIYPVPPTGTPSTSGWLPLPPSGTSGGNTFWATPYQSEGYAPDTENARVWNGTDWVETSNPIPAPIMQYGLYPDAQGGLANVHNVISGAYRYPATTHRNASGATLDESDAGAIVLKAGTLYSVLDADTVFIGRLPQPNDWGAFDWNDPNISWS